MHFSVAFPKTLPLNVVSALAAVLPRPEAAVLSGEEEDVALVEVDVSQVGKDDGRSAHADRDDDDDDAAGGGAQRVQCGQA